MRAAACAFAAAMGGAAPATAELFEGCPSKPIMGKFIEFGKAGKMPKDLGKWLNTPAAQQIEPWKPFDNVDYVGICWVSAWLVHTDDGIVLIDTLYGPFVNQLIENIKAAGVDLADIKYVLMTHGHFDHSAGAATLKPMLPNAKFVMSQRGWDEAAKSAATSFGRRKWEMIPQDVVMADGETFELGGNSFMLIETPGHTWGTSSYSYNVKDGDDTFRAVTIGGLGLNAIQGPDQVEAYIASVDRLKTMVEDPDNGVQVHLTTHGFSNNLDEDRVKLAERKPGEPNVLVNPEGILDQIAGLRERAEKRLEIEKNK